MKELEKNFKVIALLNSFKRWRFHCGIRFNIVICLLTPCFLRNIHNGCLGTYLKQIVIPTFELFVQSWRKFKKDLIVRCSIIIIMYLQASRKRKKMHQSLNLRANSLTQKKNERAEGVCHLVNQRGFYSLKKVFFYLIACTYILEDKWFSSYIYMQI